jgi:hypothetical protein
MLVPSGGTDKFSIKPNNFCRESVVVIDIRRADVTFEFLQ